MVHPTFYLPGRQMTRNDVLPFLIEAFLRLGLRQASVARHLRCANNTVCLYAKRFGLRQKTGWKPGDPRNKGTNNAAVRHPRPRKQYATDTPFTQDLDIADRAFALQMRKAGQ